MCSLCASFYFWIYTYYLFIQGFFVCLCFSNFWFDTFISCRIFDRHIFTFTADVWCFISNSGLCCPCLSLRFINKVKIKSFIFSHSDANDVNPLDYVIHCWLLLLSPWRTQSDKQPIHSFGNSSVYWFGQKVVCSMLQYAKKNPGCIA